MKKQILIGMILAGSLYANDIMPGQNQLSESKCPYSKEECASKKLGYHDNHRKINDRKMNDRKMNDRDGRMNDRDKKEKLSKEEVNYMKYMIYKDKVENDQNQRNNYKPKDKYMINRDRNEGFRDDFRDEMRKDMRDERRYEGNNIRTVEEMDKMAIDNMNNR